MRLKRFLTASLLVLAALFALLSTAAAESLPAVNFPVVDTDRLKAMFDDPTEDFVLIDARTPEEYDEVHLPRAINIPDKKFAEHLDLLPPEKDRTLIFYCNGIKCGKSKRAAVKAAELGYTDIIIYAEGAPVWEERGMPIVAGADHEKRIETTRLAPAELKAWIDGGRGDFTIIDVRDAEEYAAGHIPGAVNIPVANFSSRAGELDKEKNLVVYCNSGGRSYNAYRKLIKLSYPKHFQALFADWQEAGLPVAR